MLYPWRIIGHEKQILQLEQEIQMKQLSHAYLFYGPKDTGKFSLAKTFAGILLCKNDYCHECRDCKMVKSCSHPDLMVMRDEGESIKIDEVRDLIRKTNLSSQGSRRIIIIENLERMPIEAQNSFLKTLEEPAGNTMFLLTSTQMRKIVPTILSRCRQYKFSLVPDELLRKAMTERFKGHGDLEEVLQIAQGRPGLAIKLLSEPAALTAYKSLFHQIDQFLKTNDTVTKFAFIEELEKDPERLDLFFDSFCFSLRKITHDYLTRPKHPLRERFSLKDIDRLFEQLLKTRYLIVDRNANKKLALENFFLLTET